jgi:hypothetical protein
VKLGPLYIGAVVNLFGAVVNFRPLYNLGRCTAYPAQPPVPLCKARLLNANYL